MKTFSVVCMFLLSFVASAAEAGVSIRQAESGNCVVASDSEARATHVRFRVITADGTGKWSKDLKPGACWTLPEAGKVQAMLYSGKRCFKNKAGKCAKFSRQLAKIPTPAPKVETVKEILARTMHQLAQCDEDLKKCKATPKAAKAKRVGVVNPWWRTRKGCETIGKTKNLVWKGYCTCPDGQSWVGKKKGKCGRGGVPVVPYKVPKGVAAVNLDDLFSRVEKLEETVYRNHEPRLQKVEIATAGNTERINILAPRMTAVEEKIKMLEQAPSSSGKWGTWPVGLKVATEGICVLGRMGNFCYQSFMPKLVLRAPFFNGTKLEITGGLGVATDYGEASKSFVAAGGLTFHVKTWLGLGIGYEYAAYNLNPSTEGARNGQSQVGVVEATFKPWWFVGIKIGVGVGSRTVNHGSANTAIAMLRFGFELYAF